MLILFNFLLQNRQVTKIENPIWNTITLYYAM